MKLFGQWEISRAKQMPKLAPAYYSPIQQVWGRAPEWAPSAYGEYYLTSTPVYAAVKVRAEATTVAPLKVYRGPKEKGNEQEPDSDGAGNPNLAQLLQKVNPYWTHGDLLRMTSTYLDLWGSCFWVLKKTSPDAQPTEIWMLKPDRMYIVPSEEFVDHYWYMGITGKRIPLRRDEVIWFRYFNPLDVYGGASPLAAARLSADMGMEALKHNRNLFKNGLLGDTLAFTAKDGASLGEEEAKAFREALRARYSGTENSHVPFVMGNFEAKNLGLTNRELEFMAGLRWSVEDVARVYSVPKMLIGDFTDAQLNNSDAAERFFWRNAMVPHLNFIAEVINEFLVPQFNDPELEVEFDVDQIDALQPNQNDVSNRDREDIKIGLKTINEVREERHMEPVPWGDVAWMPMGIQAIETPEDGKPQPIPAGLGGDPNADPNALASLPPGKRYVVSTHKKFEPFPDSFVEKILELHNRGLAKGEGNFKHLQTDLFEQQKREVLRNVLASRSAGTLTVKALPDFQLFSIRDWVKRYLDRGRGLYTTIATAGAVQQINAFSLPVAFDVSKMEPWLANRATFWATRVNEETARLLIDELKEGIGLGDSIRKLQDRVERVFEFSDAVRSERIARTESQSAMNAGAVESYKQSGVVERKMWLATMDARTRDAHAIANRETVDIHDRFIVGNELLDHPGDGSPENAINCRCVVAPVIQLRALQLPKRP